MKQEAATTMIVISYVITLVSMLASANTKTIEYDFETGLDDLVQNPYNTVIFRQKTINELRKIKDSPIPGHPDGNAGVAVVDVLSQVSGGAAFNTPGLNIPDGATVALDYFARAYLPEANGVQVFYLENAPVFQVQLLNLYSKANPQTDRWYTASANVPAGLRQPVQVR